MAATKRGYAVAVIDAFYKKGLKGSSKTKFPQASKYGAKVAALLAEDPRIDANNIYYTGFSYGATQVNRMLKFSQMSEANINFAAMAAAEPGCNVFLEPRNYETPLLVLKGEKSHYQPKPCKTMVDLYRDAGMTVEYLSFPKSNHFFSHNGKIVRGTAVNGCADDPVIITNKGYFFLSGNAADRKAIRKKCFTNQGG